ncbi:MAG: LysR family transcriptional regulator [Burkholderiaceae bacterium]
MNQDFNWSLVRSFLAALDRGSLLGAARALNASQPTIGRHIAELESQLGVVLFERTGRGLLPSDAALRLAESARAMEGAALKLARSATMDQTGITGSVRISASQPIACVLLPPLLAQMRGVLPDVQVELVVSNAVSNLLRREADIAVRMVQPDQATLVARRVGKVTLGVYAHRDYLRRHGTPRQPTDLLSHTLVGFDQSPDIIEGFANYGLRMQRENFALRTDDLIAHCEAVRAGFGIGFLANYVAQSDTRLIALLPMLKLPPLPVWLVVHREIRTNQRIRKVFDFLASAIPAALTTA